MAWSTVGGADTGMPLDVARRFAKSDAPGKLPKFVATGGGLGKQAEEGLGSSPRELKGQFQAGGMTGADMPFWTRAEARQIQDQPFHGGLIPSSGAGRTDQLPLAVPPESHVLPAYTIAGLGQDNTLAGARVVDAMLKIGPWGTALPAGARGRGPPAPPHEAGLMAGLGQRTPRLASVGGEMQEGGHVIPADVTMRSRDWLGQSYPSVEGGGFYHEPWFRVGDPIGRGALERDVDPISPANINEFGMVPRGRGTNEGGAKHEISILAAGGEYVVPREDWLMRDEHGQLNLHAGVRTIGEGDIQLGHERLNQMIERVRQHSLKFLKSAPPPKS